MVKALIDSDVLIDFLQGVPEAQKELQRYSDRMYSIISWMEVQCGADDDAERVAADPLFQSMKMLPVSPEIAKIAVAERKAHGLKLPAAIILATADCEGCILVTRNTKDFSADDPRVRFPYAL